VGLNIYAYSVLKCTRSLQQITGKSNDQECVGKNSKERFELFNKLHSKFQELKNHELGKKV